MGSFRPGVVLAWVVVAGLGWSGPGEIGRADDPPPARPIRALLVTGGPFHDYRRQEKLLTEAIKARANVEWTVVFEEKGDTDYQIPLFEKPDWAAGFDVVVHNECYADVDDPAYVAKVVAVHKAGVPAVVIHCAMHTFRSLKTDQWHEFLGVTTFRHGAQHPLDVRADRPTHPIMQGFPASWTTGNEELYHIEKLWPDSVALASAAERDGTVNPVFWTHQYGRGRVFGTTLPHNHQTLADPVFLDVLGRGLLWACGRLDEAGKPTAGSGPVRGAEPR